MNEYIEHFLLEKVVKWIICLGGNILNAVGKECIWEIYVYLCKKNKCFLEMVTCESLLQLLRIVKLTAPLYSLCY